MKPLVVCIFVSILAFSFLFASDVSIGMGSCKHKQCDKWIKTFFQLPLEERIRRFSNYTLEDQYSIYTCGNEVVHPPAMYLAGPLAMNGKAAVHFLKVKLLQAKNDLLIHNIILIFAEMSRRKTYDIMGDRQLVRLLDNSVAKMKNEEWRHMVDQMMKEISGGKWRTGGESR